MLQPPFRVVFRVGVPVFPLELPDGFVVCRCGVCQLNRVVAGPILTLVCPSSSRSQLNDIERYVHQSAGQCLALDSLAKPAGGICKEANTSEGVGGTDRRPGQPQTGRSAHTFTGYVVEMA